MRNAKRLRRPTYGKLNSLWELRVFGTLSQNGGPLRTVCSYMPLRSHLSRDGAHSRTVRQYPHGHAVMCACGTVVADAAVRSPFATSPWQWLASAMGSRSNDFIRARE
jgi:hypothetical protein